MAILIRTTVKNVCVAAAVLGKSYTHRDQQVAIKGMALKMKMGSKKGKE